MKKSIVGNKSTPNFGASGQYLLFGMNALYKIDHKIFSIGLYGRTKGRDDCHDKVIEKDLSWRDKKLSVSLEQAVLSQSELFIIV